VVVILCEWWSAPTTADHCGHIPAYVEICNKIIWVLVVTFFDMPFRESSLEKNMLAMGNCEGY